MVRGMMDKKVMLQKYSVSSIDSRANNQFVYVSKFMRRSCLIHVFELSNSSLRVANI